jgi:hypothetical protein
VGGRELWIRCSLGKGKDGVRFVLGPFMIQDFTSAKDFTTDYEFTLCYLPSYRYLDVVVIETSKRCNP